MSPLNIPSTRSSSVIKSNIHTVRDKVPSTDVARIADELLDCETNRGVVRGHNCTRARADDHVDGNVVSDQLLKHSDVAGAAEPSAPQHKADTHRRIQSSFVRMAELSDHRQPESRLMG
jgi:hypothetical protein